MASAPTRCKTLGGAQFVVAATPYADETLKSVAHVLLPISTFVETSGTYVNLEGLWQSFAGAAQPLGEARPGWKVLRVLGNLAGRRRLRLPVVRRSARRVARALRGYRAGIRTRARTKPAFGAWRRGRGEVRVIDVPMYAVDAVLRRAPSLQRTREGKRPRRWCTEARAHELIDQPGTSMVSAIRRRTCAPTFWILVVTDRR